MPGRSHFNLLIKTLVIYMYIVHMVVPVIRYSLFICALLFVIDRSIILFIVRLFILLFSFSLIFFYSLFKRKRAILILNRVQVFRFCYLFKYPIVPVQVHLSPSSLGVNKHHTADSTDFVLV
jgi:hypothetical protein